MATGTAEQVAAALREVLDAGVEYLALRPMFEFVEQAALHEQLRRIAEQVVPAARWSGGGMRFLLEHPAPARARRPRRVCRGRAQGRPRRRARDGVAGAAGALVSAAAVAARVDEVLVAAEVVVGARHPVEIAEEAAVTDLGSGGRLVLVARPAGGEPGRYAESLDVVRHALAAKPFRFEGEHWRVPANLPENVDQPEERVRVTPAPAQPRLEVWGAGPAGARRSRAPSAISPTRATIHRARARLGRRGVLTGVDRRAARAAGALERRRGSRRAAAPRPRRVRPGLGRGCTVKGPVTL